MKFLPADAIVCDSASFPLPGQWRWVPTVVATDAEIDVPVEDDSAISMYDAIPSLRRLRR